MKKEKLLPLVVVMTFLLAAPSAAAQVSWMSPSGANHNIIHPPSWVFELNQSPYIAMGDNRAMVVSSGCDVNGDGYDDLLVGRKDYDVPIEEGEVIVHNAGRAWLFLGSAAGLSNTPSVTFDPPLMLQGGLFGSNVACAGDINQDGYEELMIGMVNYTTGPLSDEGAEFVYYGSSTGPKTTPDWMARGNSVWGFMGTYADSAGDVNDDGYDDIIIGTGENSQQAVAHAYVWYGGSAGLGAPGVGGATTNADWVATDPNPRGVIGDLFGFFVYGAGDVNGDGFDDVMITACCSYIQEDQYPGAAYVYYGSSTGLSNNVSWMATGGLPGERLGVGGDGVGDLNGDGYDDLAIGVDCYSCALTDGGKVFVWYGSSNGLGPNGTPGNADWSAQGSGNSLLGIVTRAAGDVDDDGFADLLVTASNDTTHTANGDLYGAGAWYIWKGSSHGLGANGTLNNADIIAHGDQGGASLGLFEAGAADVNNDGLDDIFVTAFLYSHPELYEGAVFGYYSPIQVWHNIYLPVAKK